MKFMGSKKRIAKHILPIILNDRLPEQYYVEPMVGGANMIDKVDGNRIGADINPFLIAYLSLISIGFVPPKFISKENYSCFRNKFKTGNFHADEMGLIGCFGFNGSANGRFFDGGYAGVSKTKDGKIRNYPEEAYKNVMKQAPNLKGIKFVRSDYLTLSIPKRSIIYCDPPYFATKEYLSLKCNFYHKEFWHWCRDKSNQGHKVYISEYNAPPDFTCVWEKEVKSSLSANGKSGGNKNSVERLFVFQ